MLLPFIQGFALHYFIRSLGHWSRIHRECVEVYKMLCNRGALSLIEEIHVKGNIIDMEYSYSDSVYTVRQLQIKKLKWGYNLLIFPSPLDHPDGIKLRKYSFNLVRMYYYYKFNRWVQEDFPVVLTLQRLQ